MNKSEIMEIMEWLRENNINIDIDKEKESMRRLGCSYFTISNVYSTARLTIDLRT